tara:strand:+ start:561 stop:809 length:249 start_codon:yes stop_codon:yes gene_type:complete
MLSGLILLSMTGRSVSVCVWDRNDIDLAASLEQPKGGNLACCISTFFAFPDTSKIAFINLDLSRHQSGASVTSLLAMSSRSL